MPQPKPDSRLRPARLVAALALALALGGTADSTPLQAARKLGSIQSTKEHVGRSYRLASARSAEPTTRPSSLQLTDYLPPIGNQEAQNSCVGWASAYYAYTYAVAKQMKLSQEERMSDRFLFSPAFVYNQINGGKDLGSRIGDAMMLLAKSGCATLSEQSYNVKDYTSQPSEAAKRRAEGFLARHTLSLSNWYDTPFDPETVKIYLSETGLPVVIGALLFHDFPKESVKPGYVYNQGSNDQWGRHAMTIVGYDDEKGFLLVNSWGEGWGEKGLLWISEAYAKKHIYESWGFIPGGNVARALPGRSIPIGRTLTALPPEIK